MTARFLIEVPHESSQTACARAVETLLTSGSHFLTHADWGCKDGVHKAWAIVEVENKDAARAIVPAAFRSMATIIQLNSFSLEEVESLLRRHDPR
jgi:hypothetical protein